MADSQKNRVSHDGVTQTRGSLAKRTVSGGSRMMTGADTNLGDEVIVDSDGFSMSVSELRTLIAYCLI